MRLDGGILLRPFCESSMAVTMLAPAGETHKTAFYFP